MGNGNFKVKCVSIGGARRDFYTEGKIYEIKDGKLTADNGIFVPGHKYISDFEDWQLYSSANFELVTENTIVIYHKDLETIALLKDGNKVLKAAKSICNPKDDFNAEYGAKLAFARLYGLDKDVTEILLNGVKEDVGNATPKYHEVKRIAKEGDSIKVVNARNVPETNGVPDYKNGDVLKIIELDGKLARYSLNTSGYMNRVLTEDEYVVLETADLSKVSTDSLLEELRKRVR